LVKDKKVQVRITLYGLETHHRATEHHLPYGITQCYLPPDTGERAPPEPQPCRSVLDYATPEGWKAELTVVLVIYQDGLPVRRQSSHTSR